MLVLVSYIGNNNNHNDDNNKYTGLTKIVRTFCMFLRATSRHWARRAARATCTGAKNALRVSNVCLYSFNVKEHSHYLLHQHLKKILHEVKKKTTIHNNIERVTRTPKAPEKTAPVY